MIKFFIGNIIGQDTDAIVNAANERLLAGAGVSGAIHAAAGSRLEEACRSIGYCPTGEARLTKGFNLKARYVIHAVAPRYFDGTRGEADLLRRTYEAVFQTAVSHSIKSIAIPAIGTGIYKFPLIQATEIALDVARLYEEQLVIRFICFDQKMFDVYSHASSKNPGAAIIPKRESRPRSGPDFFVKIIEMLQQNWAFIEPKADGKALVYFLTDTGDIFDEMIFSDPEEAQRALGRNGFENYSSNLRLHQFLRPPYAPFQYNPSMRRPIYSSGEFWRD